MRRRLSRPDRSPLAVPGDGSRVGAAPALHEGGGGRVGRRDRLRSHRRRALQARAAALRADRRGRRRGPDGAVRRSPRPGRDLRASRFRRVPGVARQPDLPAGGASLHERGRARQRAARRSAGRGRRAEHPQPEQQEQQRVHRLGGARRAPLHRGRPRAGDRARGWATGRSCGTRASSRTRAPRRASASPSRWTSPRRA